MPTAWLPTAWQPTAWLPWESVPDTGVIVRVAAQGGFSLSLSLCVVTRTAVAFSARLSVLGLSLQEVGPTRIPEEEVLHIAALPGNVVVLFRALTPQTLYIRGRVRSSGGQKHQRPGIVSAPYLVTPPIIPTLPSV